jgi:hypothetical protein
VAVFAFGIGFDMVRGFSSCHFFIVAGKTAINDWRVINMDFCPSDLIVALAAFRVGAWMGGRLALGHVVVVAAGAAGGDAFENAADMAGFASYILMGAMQGKFCLTVVEVLINFCEAIGSLCIGGRNDKREGDRKQSDQNLQL